MRVAVALVAAISMSALLALAAASGAADAPPAALQASAGQAAVPAIDVAALVHEAQRVQRADMRAWSNFRFRRDVLVERLDAAGVVIHQSLLEFEILPMAVGGFDERLIRIEGREPTVEELTRYREDASFSRHYRTLTTTDEEGDEESGYSLATLLRLSEYRYRGVEKVKGAPAHRLDFEPDPVPQGSGVAARVTQTMAGTIWLTVEGAHLVRAHAATVRPVSLYLGLGKVHSIEVGLDAAPAGPMAPDVYLPTRLTVHTNLRVIFSNQHRRRTFTYSDYAPIMPSAGRTAATN